MTHDPKKKVWTRIPDMIYVRGDTEAVATDGALIVAERYRVCNVIERYSPQNNVWKTVNGSIATEDSDEDCWGFLHP